MMCASFCWRVFIVPVLSATTITVKGIKTSKQINMKIFSLRILIVIGSSLVFDSCADGQVNNREGFPQVNSTVAPPNPISFVNAARITTPAVVNVKTLHQSQATLSSIFGGRGNTAVGSGSGVVISPDGYIATNNHVIEGATTIEVVFPNRRRHTAEVVGRDPDTDLALLKVDANNLDYLALGNSDNVQVGEPVLAVGYPFSLNTTVTAGIVSAKGRAIGIIGSDESPYARGQQYSTAIESFIQTDAAINPGNSGGALVNIRGELIGINTAIASLTGSYAGYAFAVPVNLAKKVLDDLRAYGRVRRGLLGVSFPSPSVEDQYFRQQGIDPGSVQGVFITGVQKGSAADQAGLEAGDIIQSIDSVQLFSSAEFSELIARHRPGDRIAITYLRDGRTRSTTARLQEDNTTDRSAGGAASMRELYEKLGAEFAALPTELRREYRLRTGVIVTEVIPGGFFDTLGIPEGTIIAFVNGRGVSTPEEVAAAMLSAGNSRIQILGIAPDGSRIAFTFSLGA